MNKATIKLRVTISKVFPADKRRLVLIIIQRWSEGFSNQRNLREEKNSGQPLPKFFPQINAD
jgi:hypothetical protein